MKDHTKQHAGQSAKTNEMSNI